jgi:hypothetical protein
MLRTPLAVQAEIEQKRWTIETVSLDQLADREWAGCRVFLSVEKANQYITDHEHEKELS